MIASSLSWLAPLWRFRPEGCGEVVQTPASEIPEPFHRLLVHTGDMTSRLEAFHADSIRLDVLGALFDEGNVLCREVLLRRAKDQRAVEYGAIEIQLAAFASVLRDEVREGHRPLGGLLNQSGVSYFSEPVAFFWVDPSEVLQKLFQALRPGRLYGRANVLKRKDGALIARIVEILPLADDAPGHSKM